jgi:hypothetical protein
VTGPWFHVSRLKLPLGTPASAPGWSKSDVASGQIPWVDSMLTNMPRADDSLTNVVPYSAA